MKKYYISTENNDTGYLFDLGLMNKKEAYKVAKKMSKKDEMVWVMDYAYDQDVEVFLDGKIY